MTSIDELIAASLPVPADDAAERAALTEARSVLWVAMQSGAHRHRRTGRWGPRLGAGLALAPALLGAVLAVLIALAAVLVIPHRSSTAGAGAGPPRGAAALVDELAVLRRPEHAGDRLGPAELRQFRTLAEEFGLGTLVPGLTRLVSERDGAKLYLAVLTPGDDLWPASDGDQAAVIEVAPNGVTVDQNPVPAVALSDSDDVQLVGDRGYTPAEFNHYAHWVSVVPDGVTTVEWTAANTDRTRAREDFVTVTDNLAQLPTHTIGEISQAGWFRSDGRRVDTANLIPAAQAAQRVRRYRAALKAAEHSHATAPADLLNAFTVFSFDSAQSTRLADGYVISKPALKRLPADVLEAGAGSDLDYQEVREITAPSGLTEYVIPGPRTLCVSLASPGGGGAICDTSIATALSEGVSGVTGEPGGAVSFGVVPSAHRTVLLDHGRQRITPEGGVFIIRSR